MWHWTNQETAKIFLDMILGRRGSKLGAILKKQWRSDCSRSSSKAEAWCRAKPRMPLRPGQYWKHFALEPGKNASNVTVERIVRTAAEPTGAPRKKLVRPAPGVRQLHSRVALGTKWTELPRMGLGTRLQAAAKTEILFRTFALGLWSRS